MTTGEFLTYLSSLNVKLWVDGDQLGCRAPKGVLTAELREELNQHKSALIALLAKTADTVHTSDDAITPVPRAAPLPLSFAQQRLWFLAQLAPTSPAYHIPLALRLDGPLDRAALDASLSALIARHESLRTAFPLHDGIPVQHIAPPGPVALPTHDLAALAPAAQAAALAQHLAEAARAPFDLALGPLVRLALLRLAPQQHVLLVTLHHAIADGWSLPLLTRDLGAAYHAARHGHAPHWPPLAIQYADYAAWQRQRLQGAALAAQLAFWQQQLADAPPLLALPTDYPRPAQPSQRGGQQRLVLDAPLVAALRAGSQAHGLTLFMTLLAGWQVLLGRWSGQDDVVVGTPVAGRTQAATEGLIGCFVNTLALRTRLGDNPTVATLLARVRATCLAAYAHQELPFELLVETLQPARSLSYPPLVQVLFVLQNLPPATLALDELAGTALPSTTGTAKFDLTLTLVEQDGGLAGTIEYNSELFAPPTIARLAGHYEVLLRALLTQPTRRCGDLPLLLPEERAQLLAWSGEAGAYPRDASVYALFMAQAARTPDAIALVAAGQPLSYAALARRANQLAHVLQQRGVGPDTLVALALPRSRDQLVALLATLAAGGAYLPLDLAVPPARQQTILAAARPVLILTATPQPALLPGLPQAACDALAPLADAAPATPPRVAVAPEQLAYVCFTSGSTGQPKGVAVPHRAVVRLVHGQPHLPLGPQHTLLQLAPLAFDAATFEIWGALLHGARLVLAPPELPSLPELAQLLAQQQVSILWLTAGLFHLVAEQQPEALAPVRVLLTGGDVVAPSAVRELQRVVPECQIINGYGPTENTTFTCCQPLTAAQAAGVRVPIGPPLRNTRVYVLDPHGALVPVGVAGELYIGGDGLARGYLNQPALTAERFVPDPFSAEGGARLYRTGDQVRWLPDGTLDFLGRGDGQVKLRGYRIELGEIEAVLGAQPEVATGLVVARERGGERQLMAYVVPEAGVEPGVVERVQAALTAALPGYMVPSAWVVLGALPLTPNGKVDRRALPEPEASGSVARVAPRTVLEQQVAAIWAEVLARPDLGVHDSFFDLGGHSLSAVQVISRVRAAFQIEISLPTLYNAPTIAQLAEYIQIVQWASHEPEPSLEIAGPSEEGEV